MNFYQDFYLMEELAFAAMSLLTSSIPTVLFAIASYVLTSMALYTLATRRGIQKAWLSWVPVLNVWIIGSLSDQYRYVVKGQYKSKRKILLILNLVNLVMAVVLLIAAVCVTMELVQIYGFGRNIRWNSIVSSAMGAIGLAVAMSGISIASMVFRYMALYDIYTSMDPANNIMFLVLSILFHVTEPFFLFFNRNKDGGMPPRREEPQHQNCWEETEEYL